MLREPAAHEKGVEDMLHGAVRMDIHALPGERHRFRDGRWCGQPAEPQTGEEDFAHRAQVNHEAEPVESHEARRRVISVRKFTVCIVLDDWHAVPRREREERVPPC